LTALLCLPLVTNWIGHPPREQAYASVSAEAGPIGMHVRELFHDRSDADILFMGSSLVRAGIDAPTVEQALSAHLGRPTHVDILALNWQGLDMQYFMLRDYMNTHHAGLIVWNLPVPRSRHVEPHVEAFRWVRFGEYSDALSGLPLRYRLALYGDMVLGAPRELLSHLRPNLLSKEEVDRQVRSDREGYYGAVFTPEPTDVAPIPPLADSYEEPPYPLVHVMGPPLNDYEEHFAEKIVALAKEKQTPVVLVHIPIDSEQGLDYMPERSDWLDTLHIHVPMIGSPSAVALKNIGQATFHSYYKDQHFNLNGSLLFTRGMLPAILRAYDESRQHE
jgi:hypothetical protein